MARVSSALLDEGGLRALTLRAVALRLGVAASSLYSRVESVDDLFDLALDGALGEDADVAAALTEATLPELMLAYYRYLVRHPWACQVVAWRAPRGPNFVRLSERMIDLLVDVGAREPLTMAYVLANYAIGCATTAPMAEDEALTPVDPSSAPEYARLHAEHPVDPAVIFRTGMDALLSEAGVPTG
ncbi:TetR family transcriptional regulator [Microbacterium sp. MYb62]|nr:TetR family transcriptional regulator [Microbacterium sp. MYb62]